MHIIDLIMNVGHVGVCAYACCVVEIAQYYYDL